MRQGPAAALFGIYYLLLVLVLLLLLLLLPLRSLLRMFCVVFG